MGRLSVLWVLALLAACHLPEPKTSLRYQAERPGDWRQVAPDQYVAQALGVRCRLDLGRRDTRVHLVVENPSESVVRVAAGTEAARSLLEAIGECRLRPMSGRQEPVLDYRPYRSLEALEVESGWLVDFYLDRPIGREPTVGQYFVFLLELRQGDQQQFLQLPLAASGWTRPSR